VGAGLDSHTILPIVLRHWAPGSILPWSRASLRRCLTRTPQGA
jgi:hypothetical protein